MTEEWLAHWQVTYGDGNPSSSAWIPVDTKNAWKGPVFPNKDFHMFYMVRVGCFMEEYMYTAVCMYLSWKYPTDENRYRKYKDDFHAETT